MKTLPTVKLQQLKAEIEMETSNDKTNINLKSLLLKGPVATKKQLETIANNYLSALIRN